jgi:hypothetical protein
MVAMITYSFCLASVLASLAIGRADDPSIDTDKKPLAELNEPPHDGIEIPPGRPEWIGKGPELTGKVHKIPVASGPYADNSESQRALDQAIAKATQHYIAEQLGSDIAPQLIQYNVRVIKKRFVKQDNTYHDVARYSVGWMHENFALLEFDQKFRDEIDRKWTKIQATSRLAETGVVSGGVLLLVGSIFGYFRLNNSTRGYYSRRLKFMTLAAMGTIVTAGAVLFNYMSI